MRKRTFIGTTIKIEKSQRNRSPIQSDRNYAWPYRWVTITQLTVDLRRMTGLSIIACSPKFSARKKKVSERLRSTTLFPGGHTMDKYYARAFDRRLTVGDLTRTGAFSVAVAVRCEIERTPWNFIISVWEASVFWKLELWKNGDWDKLHWYWCNHTDRKIEKVSLRVIDHCWSRWVQSLN